jgi:hypothetical protein|tara:strand:- start:195 stop:452 length:258 start_codon:yes stop_codon:yes gene_type:complete
MDFNDIIASLAFGIGFIQMYSDVKNSDELDEKAKKRLILGVIASLLWLTYQGRKYGVNTTTMYTTIGLLVQVYLLNKILLKDIKD